MRVIKTNTWCKIQAKQKEISTISGFTHLTVHSDIPFMYKNPRVERTLTMLNVKIGETKQF